MALMDPLHVWALVALAALAAAYDLGRRVVSARRHDELDAALRPIRQQLETEQQRADLRLQDVLGLREWCGQLRDGAEVTRQDVAKLRADLDAFIAEDKATWDTVGAEWRKTVAELHSKVDGVTDAAKNEINGALAGVDAVAGSRRAWR